MSDFTMKSKIFTVTADGVDQDFEIAGFGFTPKAAIITACLATADATPVTEAGYCIGFTDGTRQAVCGMLSEDDQNNTDASRWNRNDAIIDLHTVTSPNGSIGTLAFGSFSADTITLSKTTNPTAAFKISVTLIGGDDVTSPRVESTSLGTGTAAVAIETSGDVPDVVFTANSGHNVANAIAASGMLSFGCMITGATQRCTIIGDHEGQIKKSNASMYDNRISGQNVADNTQWLGTGAFTGSGFSVQPNSSASSDILHSLVFTVGGSPDLSLATITIPASGNINYETPAFDTSYAMVNLITDVTAANTIGTANGNRAFTIFSVDDENVAVTGFTLEDGTGNTACESFANDGAVTIYDTDNATAIIESSAESVDSLGLNLTLTANELCIGWAFCIGEPDGGGGVSSTPNNLMLLGAG